MARDLEADRDYYLVPEVAALLRLHPKTVERAIRRGDIPGRREEGDRRWRIPRTELLTALVGEFGRTSPALRPSLQQRTLAGLERRRRPFITRPARSARSQPTEAIQTRNS